jgi:hypothetical protein
MKNPAFIVLVFLVVAISGVIWWLSNSGPEAPKPLTKYQAVRSIYNKLDKIDLPYVYPSESDNLDEGLSTTYRVEGADTVLLDSSTILLGALKDTSNFFTFIQVIVGDYNSPSIVTISKKGKLISRRLLSLGGGDDCGYQFEEKNVLAEDLSINLYLKETYSGCEEEEDVPTTVTETTQTGYINPKGRIIMRNPDIKKSTIQDSTANQAVPMLKDSSKTALPAIPPKM